MQITVNLSSFLRIVCIHVQIAGLGDCCHFYTVTNPINNKSYAYINKRKSNYKTEIYVFFAFRNDNL